MVALASLTGGEREHAQLAGKRDEGEGNWESPGARGGARTRNAEGWTAAC